MTVRPVVWTSRATAPGAGAFAVLFGLEALGRALMIATLPPQRTEMTPIFPAQRDLSDIAQAGVFVVLLSVLPVQAVYLVLTGLTLLVLRINPRL